MEAKMITAINTKVCTRCHGSGSYSFNLKDGTVCYGCGGTGKMLTAPKGQKKLKPTCTSIYKAVVGDILEVGCILYRVEDIRWISYRIGKNSLPINQRLQVTRLVDDKVLYFSRGIADAQGFSIKTPEAWIGKEVFGKGIAE